MDKAFCTLHQTQANCKNSKSSDNKNPKDGKGRACIHYASLNGHTLLVKYILHQSPKDVNPSDVDGITPLHLAASRGHFAICVLIMSKVRDKNPSARSGQTPLHLSAQYGHYSVCKLFLENIHNKNPSRSDGRTPHDLAVLFLNSLNHERICRLIRTHMNPLPIDANPRNELCQLWNQLHLKEWNSKHEANFEIETISIRLERDILITPSTAKPFNLQLDELMEIDNMLIVKHFLGTGSDPEIFMELYKAKSPGAIIHSTNCNVFAIMRLFRNEYRILDCPLISFAMITDENSKNENENIIPIISDWRLLGETVGRYPTSPAVMIHHKGLFVWGKSGNSAAIRLDSILQILELNCKLQMTSFEMQKLGLKACHIPCKSVRHF